MPKGVYKRATIPSRIRFESKIEMIPECGCWIWMGTVCGPKRNYGHFSHHNNGTSARAHRVSWELYRGLIPKRLNVLHRCDTPLCVNPHHLFLGTQKDNIRDCIGKKRFVYNGTKSKGEHNGSAKLTAKKIMAIRESTQRGAVIAKRYKIHIHTVYKIKSKKVWKHLL